MTIHNRSAPSLTVTPFDADDMPAVLAMLGRCSSASLYQRFHGATRPRAASAIVATQLASDATESFVAYAGDRCVGLATLVTDGGRAEMGVIVEDAWQRRGVGGALVSSLARRAREIGVASLRADLLTDHSPLIPRLARAGRLRATFDRDGYHVEITLGEERAA